MTFLEFCTDPKLLGKTFADPSFAAVRTLIAVLSGLPLDADGVELFKRCTNRSRYTPMLYRAVWLVLGRRAAKTLLIAANFVYLAVTMKFPRLAPGEVPVLAAFSTDRRQSTVLMGYVSGLLHSSPMLEKLIVSETRDSIELSTGVRIEITTNNFRTCRGRTFAAVACDEIGFWWDESTANPDKELLIAVKPGLATTGGPLLCASSPYNRTGELWREYQNHYGVDDDPVLIWQAPTIVMNPTIPQHVIDDAFADDPTAAAAEWGAEFRDDVSAFVPLDVINSVVIPGRYELPPSGDHQYTAFTDAAGGSGRDSFAVAVAHIEGERAVLDCIRERRPPFSPEAVVAEFADVLAAYRCSTIVGDRYAGTWPAERFRRHHIDFEPAPFTKSQLYLEMLPALTSGRVELLDHKRLISQLRGLERRTSRVGRDIVDHGRSGFDDVANAAAGALVLAEESQQSTLTVGRLYGV